MGKLSDDDDHMMMQMSDFIMTRPKFKFEICIELRVCIWYVYFDVFRLFYDAAVLYILLYIARTVYIHCSLVVY